MREILFRGKRVDNGEWVEGQYVYLLNPKTENGQPIKHFIHDGTPFGVQIDPETICEYTGLTDKNGRKVFEGDIVMTGVRYDKPYSKSRKEKRLIGKVEHYIGEGKGFFNDNTGKWDAHKMYSSEWKVTIPNTELNIKYCCYTWGDFFDCEVIGNIHDNPELIGGEKK